MVRRTKSLLSGLMTVFSLVLLISAVTTADTASTSNSDGMKISPVRTDLIITPGQTKTVIVSIQNVTQTDGVYSIITNDFQAKDETGAPSLLLNGDVNSTHGLKKYMTTPKTVEVAAGQQKEVNVTITMPSDIAGGGYYGAVRFAPTSGPQGKSNVSLSGSVASLILVSVPGNVNENMRILSFGANKGENAGNTSLFTTNKNLKASVRFQNSGNVQEQPFGKILLKKGDKTLSTYEINTSDPRGNVLPDSIRRFDVPLKGVGSFGKYTLVGNFGYGTNGQLLSATSTFYVVPLVLIGVFVVVVLLLIALIFGGPRAMKRYNQRVLRRAGRR
jgi:hypothetical protein